MQELGKLNFKISVTPNGLEKIYEFDHNTKTQVLMSAFKKNSDKEYEQVLNLKQVLNSCI